MVKLLKGGELLMECLAAQGVDTIFAIPDGTYNIVFEWLHHHGERRNMRIHTMHHEAAGAHMADGYARACGRPAVVMSCAGPGAANMVTGVVTAACENIPLLAITTSRRTDLVNPDRGGMQHFDQHAVYKPSCKFSVRVSQWSHIPDAIAKAFRIMFDGIPGPVHLDIAEDVLVKMQGRLADALPKARVVPSCPAADPEAVKHAVALLSEATFPVFVCGSAVVRADASQFVYDLTRHLNCAVTTSLGGRGALPEDYPLCFPALSPLRIKLMERADVVFMVGGNVEKTGVAPKQKLIFNHVDAACIGGRHKIDVALLGNCRTVLRQVLGGLKKKNPEQFPVRPALVELKAKEAEESAKNDEKTHEEMKKEAPITRGVVLKMVRDFFPAEAVMCVDGANPELANAATTKVLGPRKFLWAAEFNHLGTGLPYAIGAKLAQPALPVFLITDARGLWGHVQELETARRLKAGVIVVVLDEGGRLACGRLDKVATALGCFGKHVENVSQLKEGLQEAQGFVEGERKEAKPSVLHVKVNG